MTYSIDFRRKVLSVRDAEKLTISGVANRFNVGIASVVRWINKLEPEKTRNKPATKINMEALINDIFNYPDAYQYERATRLCVSKQCIGYALKRLGVTYKKNSISPKSRRRRTAYLSKKD